MSSYRSYVPWKSNLQTSYKSGSSSAYSSRDDITGSRYGSASTPTSYRPSFSGGTYRVKRDPPVTPYVSRYSVTPSRDEKDKSAESSRSSQQQKYLGSSSNTSNKENSCNLKVSPSRYSTSTSNLSKYDRRSRDPSPAPDTLRPTSSLSATRIKSREPSPAPPRALRGKSRDPSPAIDTKCKLGGAYGSSYRMSSRNTPSSGYTSRYGNSSSISRQSTTPLDNAISYLSVSDFRARSVSRAREIAERKSYDKEIEKEPPIVEKVAVKSSESKETTPETEAEEEEEETSDGSSEEVFVAVSVCTRGTSPTPPSASTVVRMRRVELAKTIEKTIQRSSKRPKTLDKEIQSDRLDDSTRYSRFGLSSRVSSYSPHESRYTSSLRYSSSVSPLTKSSRSRSRTDMSERHDVSKSKSPDTKAIASPKSKLSPPKSVRMNSRQASVENLSVSSKTSPETEGVIKTVITVAKLPNKDFRKSALNVGPTDRPRKSRTPSTSTDSDDKLDSKKVSPPTGTTQFLQRQEKSPSSSSGSETSTTSPKSSTKKKVLNGETKIRQRCHPAKASSSSPSSSTSHSPSGRQSTKINVNIVPENKSSGVSESSSDNRKAINRPVAAITISPRETGASDAPNENTSGNRREQPPVADDVTPATNKTIQIDTPESLDSPHLSAVEKAHTKENQGDGEDGAKINLIEKLGSISNFFAARQHDTNSEPLYVDRRSSESTSGDSISSDLKQKVSKTTAVPLTESNANRAISIDLNTNSTTSPSTISITAPPSSGHTEPSDECEDTSSNWWQDTSSQQISTASALDIQDDMRYKLRHIDSGEVGWWLKTDEDDTLADNMKTLNQDDNEEDVSELTDPILSSRAEENWWNEQNEIIQIDPKVAEQSWPRIEDQAPAPTYSSPNKYSPEATPKWSDTINTYPKKSPEIPQTGSIKLNICRVESGERPWWMEDEKSSSIPSPPKEKSPTKRHPNSNGYPLDRSSSNSNFNGDKPWWMSGPTKKIFNIRHVESGERPAWLQNDEEQTHRVENNLNESDEDGEGDSETDDEGELLNATSNVMEERLPPLGDRASPDGLEDPNRHRKSPYENVQMMKTQTECNGGNSFNAQKLFISRHTNIDELLGGSCRPLSPLVDRYTAKNVFLEEITPDQVRIHDSTAQMPVIQRMERDEWDYNGAPRVQPPWWFCDETKLISRN